LPPSSSQPPAVRRRTPAKCGSRSSEAQIPRESAKAGRPFASDPTKKFSGRLPSELDCPRPLFGITGVDQANRQFATLCIDRRCGKTSWRRTVTAEAVEKVHEISSTAASTPATDGERVYVYFGSYGLLCYDFAGNLKWERRLPTPENPYGAVTSPIVAGDFLVLNHQGKNSYLLAIDRRNGRTVWKTDRSMFQYGWSTPMHWRHDGLDEIVVLGGDFTPNQRLMAYNLSDPSGTLVGRRAAARREKYAGYRGRFAVSRRTGHHLGAGRGAKKP